MKMMSDLLARTLDLKEAIRELAYHIWVSEGRPSGRDLEHWHQAEKQLLISLAVDPELIEKTTAPPPDPSR